MTIEMSDVRDGLRAVDPAAGTAPYSADRQAEIITRVFAESQPGPASRDAVGTAKGRQILPGRRSVRTAVAAALTAAAAAVAGALLLPDNAVAAQMDQLAAAASGPVPSNEYLYTETRTLTIGGSAKPAPTDRRWDTETSRAWQGDTCNDRLDIILAPTRFFSPKDEQAFRAQASQKDLATAVHGWTATFRGQELWALDDVPCTQMGSFEHPNPAYAATYPSKPSAFLAKVVTDSGARPDQPFNTPADAVVKMLGLPYLTTEQRSAALRAFGLAAGEWTVSGHTTVAGVPGVSIRRDLGPVEEELVISSRAPGVLRSVVTITDPAHAPAFDPRYAELAAGTVVRDQELLRVGVVADLDTTPRTT